MLCNQEWGPDDLNLKESKGNFRFDEGSFVSEDPQWGSCDRFEETFGGKSGNKETEWRVGDGFA